MKRFAALRNQATPLHSDSQFQEAEALTREAPRLCERHAPSATEIIGKVANNLATILKDSGQHSEAETMHKRSLAASDEDKQ